jgi:hypothetical protein
MLTRLKSQICLWLWKALMKVWINRAHEIIRENKRSGVRERKKELHFGELKQVKFLCLINLAPCHEDACGIDV